MSVGFFEFEYPFNLPWKKHKLNFIVCQAFFLTSTFNDRQPAPFFVTRYEKLDFLK